MIMKTPAAIISCKHDELMNAAVWRMGSSWPLREVPLNMNMEKDIDKMLLRPVSTLEYNARKFGIVVSRNRIKGEISLAHFRQALQIITQRHPFLGAAFYEHESRIHFKIIEGFSPPLTIKENITTPEQREALYEEELNSPIDPYDNLWRVLLILDGSKNEIDENSHIDVILSLQHAICDGLSILNLAKEILEQVRALDESSLLYENQKLSAAPPFDDFLPAILDNDIDRSCPEPSVDYETVDTLGRHLSVPKSQCRIHCITGSFAEGDMRGLCRISKRVHVSIHGLMAACIMKAISDCIDNPADKELRLLLRNPVNRRKQVSPPLGNQALLCFVASELILCTIRKTTSIAEIGRHIMHQLDQDIQNNKALKRYRTVVESADRDQMDKEKYVQALTLSNVGLIDTPADYGKFELLDTNFISSNKHHAIQLSFTTFLNRLHYVMLYTSPWYEMELIKTINDRFRNHLSNFLYSETQIFNIIDNTIMTSVHGQQT